MKRTVFLSLIVVLSIKCISVAAQSSEKESPTLSHIGEPGDSQITFTYSVPESTFVDILVFSRIGELVAALVHETKAPGTYTVQLDKSGLYAGTYFSYIVCNHIDRTSLNIFNHYNNGYKTNTQEERELFSHANGISDSEPKKSVDLFEKLFHENPDYIDKSAAYFYSIPAYIDAADSTTVFSVIDSLVTLIPRSKVYDHIAATLLYKKKYLSSALDLSKKAIENSDDVPELYLDESRFKFYLTNGEIYMLLNDFKAAGLALNNALSTFEKIPPHRPAVKSKGDVIVHQKLGEVYEEIQQYDSALNSYINGIRRDADNSDLWESLKRVYILKHGSDAGYNSYRESLSVGSAKHSAQATVKKDNMTPFPDFDCKTLDSETVSLSSLSDKIKIISFWSYWCSVCLDERPTLDRLYSEYKDLGVEVIGIHPEVKRDFRIKRIRKALEEYPASFKTIIDTDSIGETVKVKGLPTTYIVDKHGYIRHVESGFDKNSSYSTFKSVIETLLAER